MEVDALSENLLRLALSAGTGWVYRRSARGERFFGYLEPRRPWRGPWRAREAGARPILFPAKLSCRQSRQI